MYKRSWWYIFILTECIWRKLLWWVMNSLIICEFLYSFLSIFNYMAFIYKNKRVNDPRSRSCTFISCTLFQKYILCTKIHWWIFANEKHQKTLFIVIRLIYFLQIRVYLTKNWIFHIVCRVNLQTWLWLFTYVRWCPSLNGTCDN